MVIKYYINRFAKWLLKKTDAKTSTQLIRDWRINMGLAVNTEFSIRDTSSIHAAVRMIKEELDELLVALKENDLIGAIDAVGDFGFVAEQLLCVLGVTDDLNDDIILEVYRSNMTKLCSNLEDAKETKDFYNKKYADSDDPFEQTFKATYEKYGDYFRVMRSDGKLLKSVKMNHPDFLWILLKSMSDKAMHNGKIQSKND